MFEEQQTHEPDSSVGTEEGQVDATSEDTSGGSQEVADPTEEALKILSSTTGRTYKDLDDAKQHIENLNKFVGNPNLRENAELFDAVVQQYANEQNISPKDAKEQLKGMVSGKKETKENVQHEIPSEWKEKLANLERESFLNKNPQAERYVSKIEEYAELKAIPLKDAYEALYGDVLQSVQDDSALDDKRQAKKSAQVSASSSGMPSKGPSKSERLMKEYQQTGDDNIMREIIKARKEELVQE